MAKKKVRISDYDLCRIGTVAQSRDFSIRDLSKHLRKEAGPMVQRMRKEGMLEQVKHGRYSPTKRGWRNIDNACEGVGR